MSKVSRSVYQKLAEENKRLLADIRTLTEDQYTTPKRLLCISKWRQKFKKEKEFNQFLKLGLQEYKKNNPNDPAVISSNELIKKINKG